MCVCGGGGVALKRKTETLLAVLNNLRKKKLHIIGDAELCTLCRSNQRPFSEGPCTSLGECPQPSTTGAAIKTIN